MTQCPIDWSQPIEWHDGTPTEVAFQTGYWGTVGVIVDPGNMPEGVRFNGHPRKTYISLIQHTGTLQDPASVIDHLKVTPKVVNTPQDIQGADASLSHVLRRRRL